MAGTPTRRRGPLHPHDPKPGFEDGFASSGAKAERSDSSQARLRRLFPSLQFDDLGSPWLEMAHRIAWARNREGAWNQVGTGRHQSGLQTGSANYVGALGEAAYADVTGLRVLSRARRQGMKGADFADGTDVMATRRWWNPWLIVPRAQQLADLLCLAAVNLEDESGPLVALVWRIRRAEMLEAAKWWEGQDEQFKDWYKNGVAHWCVNWRSFPVVGTGYDPPGRIAAPAQRREKPPEHISQPPRPQYNAREAVAEMRRILGTKGEP